ncbi:MAG: hypothetical protein IJZ79_07375 [Bacilli bacterium]|nr:hypothetical protein [Bacilli bacterium]
MNFYDFNQNCPNQMPFMNNQLPIENTVYKINELENHIKKLELRIQRLESLLNDNIVNNNEPDKGLYMI